MKKLSCLRNDQSINQFDLKMNRNLRVSVCLREPTVTYREMCTCKSFQER